MPDLKPNLIVLDMHLPHVSGINVLHQMHAEIRLLDTRIIVATADSSLANQLQDLADLVLIKPVTFSQIRDLAILLVPSVKLLSKPGSDLSEAEATSSPPSPDHPHLSSNSIASSPREEEPADHPQPDIPGR